jgi:hypothetical protein
MIQDAGEEATMSMKACYAWDKKKFLNHKIYKGEGLAGQSWQEGDIVYLTEVPQSYVKITSGLGDSEPNKCVDRAAESERSDIRRGRDCFV